ncbi:MAG: hypothetical protein ABMA13_22155, partial [Chthoniobacteraceae bacterium]
FIICINNIFIRNRISRTINTTIRSAFAFFAADTGGASGGGEPPKPAAEDEPATLAEAKAALKTARENIAAAALALTKAQDDTKAATDLLETVTKERDDARTELADAKGKLVTAEASGVSLTAITGALKNSLALSDEQVGKLGTDAATIIPAAIENLAGRKAVEIAASQGVPPVRTDPAKTGAEDEVKAAFALAAAEPDPRKKGELFAKARERLAASAKRVGSN